jgi:UrcA family protein
MSAIKYKFPAAIGVALLTLSFSAMASGSDPYIIKREISYQDLDLSRSEDAARLYGRIEHVAREVCRIWTGPAARAVPIEKACASKAVEEAVQSVSNSNLTAVHIARTAKRAMVASNR